MCNDPYCDTQEPEYEPEPEYDDQSDSEDLDLDNLSSHGGEAE